MPGRLNQGLLLGIAHPPLPALRDAVDAPLLPKTLQILGSVASAHPTLAPELPDESGDPASRWAAPRGRVKGKKR